MSVDRVSKEVHEENKKLKVKTRAPTVFLETLRYAGKAGKFDSERIDEILYGESE